MRNDLIILMGMARSGTTWLGKIFDSHPDTLYRHEPDSAQRIRGMPLFADVAHASQYSDVIRDVVDELPGAWLSNVSATLPIFRKSYYAQPQFLMRKCGILAAKIGAKIWGEMPVPEVIDLRQVPQLLPVWKSIESLGRLGVLCRSLPACRAVLIIRHPCGYIASQLRGEATRKFKSSSPGYDDVGIFEMLMNLPQATRYGLSIESIRGMRPVERLAWSWVLQNEKAMNDVSGMPNCSHICYEDLCSDPIKQSAKLFEFGGLDWNEQTEDFIRQSTASDKSSYYSLFKDPLKSANKWRVELDPADIERVAAVVRDTGPGKLYAGFA